MYSKKRYLRDRLLQSRTHPLRMQPNQPITNPQHRSISAAILKRWAPISSDQKRLSSAASLGAL